MTTEELPLAGIRVIDITVVWAGPGATTLLGDLGAEVIRPEGNNRTSRQVSSKVTKEVIAATGYHGGTYPDKDPGLRPYDRSALFNWHSRNKLAACMNLETPEGREALLELVKISDVLVENNSNGVLEKLGVGHERLLKCNPRLIVARMPPLGMSGPMSTYLGYGPNFNSLVGIAEMDGYQGEEPDSAGENYHMDEAAPGGLAFAVLAALWDREETGRGGLIEFSQAENVMTEIGEWFLDWQYNGRNPVRYGNADPHMTQGVFRTCDDDTWVAISVRGDRDADALATVVVADEPTRHATPEDIKRWCRKRAADDIVEALQAVKVPAGEVMSERRLLDDRHLAARGWFAERGHPAVGTHRYPGHPWRSDDFELRHGRPLPGFGEDNEYVYLELLEWPRERYDDLVARGLITDHQLA